MRGHPVRHARAGRGPRRRARQCGGARCRPPVSTGGTPGRRRRAPPRSRPPQLPVGEHLDPAQPRCRLDRHGGCVPATAPSQPGRTGSASGRAGPVRSVALVEVGSGDETLGVVQRVLEHALHVPLPRAGRRAATRAAYARGRRAPTEPSNQPLNHRRRASTAPGCGHILNTRGPPARGRRASTGRELRRGYGGTRSRGHGGNGGSAGSPVRRTGERGSRDQGKRGARGKRGPCGGVAKRLASCEVTPAHGPRPRARRGPVRPSASRWTSARATARSRVPRTPRRH